MQRKALLAITAALTFGCASTAFAQDRDLSGVTMRVLDDVKDIDAVVIALDDDRGETADEQGDAARGDGEHRDGERGARDADGDRDDSAARDADGDEERAADRRESDHEDLGDDERDERREGELEDHDVTRDPALEGETEGDRDGEPTEP